MKHNTSIFITWKGVAKTLLVFCLLLTPLRMLGAGFTPTDAGLAVNFQPGDKFLLSVWIDLNGNGEEETGEEFFVSHYPSYTGGRFKYKAAHELRLIPQTAGATVPSEASVWTIDTAVTRVQNKVDYALGGISYTMWSSANYALMSGTPTSSSDFKFLGCLTNNTTSRYLCDVVFVVPTVRATTNMDPNGTLDLDGYHRGDGSAGHPTWAFDGKMGTGFAGMTYREVYWFDIPRFNSPNAYTNASLVTVNTTLSNVKCANGDFTLTPGMAGYAFADNKHKPTPRTLFRLYVLGEKEFHGCNSYFFGWDTQNYLRYRQSNTMTDFTSWRKIYTLDHFECMDLVREGDPFFQTRGMKVPDRDSVYYYVGYNNAYHSAKDLGSGSPKSASVFTPIDSLRIRVLKDQPKAYVPAKNAYGYMAIDTTSSENNLGVAFEPAGYFFQTNTGTNVRMSPVNDSTWMVDDMWYIDPKYMTLQARIMLYTGAEFSATDPGAVIEGWSVFKNAVDIPVVGGGTASGQYGWARIHTNRAAENGGMEFVVADKDKYIHYDYNGHFGAPVPNTHPENGKTKVAVQAPRLLGDYKFICWTDVADTTGLAKDAFHKYNPGDSVTLSGVLNLYAQATYEGAINVAISFLKEDGKRYFLTHPGGAPRYARARYYNDWTNVRQGIGDADNSDPNYLTSYKILGREGACAECKPGEYVLDPKHETMKGGIDSLIFYEDYQPNGDEYLGLYYTDPNTIIANNTWAGLFTSSLGWPTPANPCIKDTRISSTHYLYSNKGVITRTARSNSDKPNVKYMPSTNQFDGVAEAGTDFMISGVGVVDAHYVILPDTTDATLPWTESITFDYHTESSMQQVWSKLIGKQLLAQMKVGNDTIYFHPNPDKTVTNANELRLSQDYRLTHTFEYIYDKRPAVADRIAEGDSVVMEETENGFCCNIYSGASSPIGDFTEDIVDTLRVWLRPASTSKVKAYYGRWKKTGLTDGLTVKSDGSRYRDILVKTKTYHYGAVQTRLALKPEHETYNFSPLAGQSQTLNFTLKKQTYRQLLDAADNVVSEEILTTKDTTVLNLTSASCTLTGGDVIFTISTKNTTSIQLTTKAQNTDRADRDTLTVTTNVGGTEVTARVPLMQAALSGSELVWSVVDPATGRRYFITAGSEGLIYREFTQSSLTLYKLNDTKTKLIKGSYDAANSKIEYITPWAYSFTGNTITLNTAYGVDKSFAILSETTPGVDASASELTFEMVRTYTNDNANYEEQVKLKYGPTPHWLKFEISGDPATPRLVLTTNEEEASTFSWSYLLDEFNIQNNGTYPNHESVEFGYNSTAPVTVQTAFKAYHEYSMLLDNKKVYVCREDEAGLANLTDAEKIWKLTYAVNLVTDARDFDGASDPTSGLSKTPASSTFSSTITPSGDSPMGETVDGLHVGVTIDGKYANIVDTLQVTVGLRGGETVDYRFKGDWSSFSSLSDACLKIPLIRKTYHEARYDSLVCVPEGEEYNYTFPATLPTGEGADSTHTFYLGTFYRHGTNTIDAEGHVVKYVASASDTLTKKMHLGNPSLAEIRLVDEYGKIPDWCEISAKGDSTVTMKCLKNGIRSPRSATLYFAYIVDVSKTSTPDYRYANFKLTVSQPSFFQYANNQTLVHSPGASGDPLMPDGRQQVHENKRILYYYNPGNYGKENQAVELPVRERGFYGWWRWYREGKDENGFNCSDMDILDSLWVTPPRNVGKFNYPFRIIGDSTWVDDKDHSKGKKLVTMGRYTVFHYPSVQYATKNDPPAKSPQVVPPINKDTVTYVVDLGAYYDNLPLSMKYINQVDTAVLDTMQHIIEPTLSLREVFELHPWTEMAAKMEDYKDTIASSHRNLKYMEDHEIMAPIGNRLLLSTEQRYNYKNLEAKGHTESLLGYYMRDDNWSTWSEYPDRQDTMIWCGGWDADCEWYTYKDGVYTKCNHPITVDDDFLNVPAKGSITAGQAADTVIYCLRARSKATTGTSPEFTDDKTVDGAYWFNICRYKIIYHEPRKYGPYEEKGTGNAAKAIITNDEIEQNYEVLERLNFDYLKPGKDYHIYPHPLPWADGSYGYTYPVTPEIPNNRYHDEKDFPGPGEYALINRIPYSTWWKKFEQHGGAENGYMIYCDGMSSSGQVAALTLSTHLCEGQKMYFSGYVGNVSSQKGKSNPNFTVSVQGSNNGTTWHDITSYMTGDIQPSDKWYQIFFPINQEGRYDQFRIRIYNEASDFDGNDFVIDDICVFATKPPLIAYQANTRCVEDAKNDSVTHVVLRVDYQGFVDQSFNNTDVYYTVEKMAVNKATKDTAYSFVPMMDGYLNEGKVLGQPANVELGTPATPDTIFGYIPMPSQTYVPLGKDSIFTNIQDMVNKFETYYLIQDSIDKGIREREPEPVLFNKGYLYESLDGMARPVLYVIHKAKMTADNTYTVRMSVAEEGKVDDEARKSAYRGLLDSKCAVTSNLKITNRMVLELNGEEVEEDDIQDICANSTYDLAMSIKGSLFLDSVAPLDVKGSCINDWLLYGDTTAYSTTRYGYSYNDIKMLLIDILRNEDPANTNRTASSLSLVNRNVMKKMQTDHGITFTTEGHTTDHPYDILTNLVNNGFLTLYQRNLTATVTGNDSVQYVIFPIVGTGTTEMNEQGMEVCPAPIFVKLKPSRGGDIPLMVGGIKRDSTEMSTPVTVLVNARTANDQVALHIDSIMTSVAIHDISLLSTDDPDFYEGVHLLNLEPDRIYTFGGDNSGYYKNGDDILLRPATSNNYTMKQGYRYTFNIVMQGLTGSLEDTYHCPIGEVPFTIGVVPDYLRWAPQSKNNNKWNDPSNWIGVDDHNDTIPFGSRFAPIASTDIIIPAMTDSFPYPEMPAPSAILHSDSVRQVNFVYNRCDDIRFLPGAAIGQQQRLNCDVTVVDMIMPYNKWALRSAPLTGMLSGDIFISEADLSGETRPWTTGSFDANGRNYKTGNATYWLSLYDKTITQKGNNDQVEDSTRTAVAGWSRLQNGMTENLAPAQGWAVYARTKSGSAADIRLPKNDDIYYYYYANGDRSDLNEPNLRAMRETNATNAGFDGAGKLAFQSGSGSYTLTNGVASEYFVFGNPTMGFIDIWGFIADNGLSSEFRYVDAEGSWRTVTSATTGTDTISNPARYLPPMHAMVIKVAEAATSKAVTLNTNRIVTSHTQVVRGGGSEAPMRSPMTNDPSQITKGIMTVTATNAAGAICTSRLLLGQGYSDEIVSGEDAILTTVNLQNYSSATPSTPFNIYAPQDGYGLSINLRNAIINVPISFSMTESLVSAFAPTTNLWFTGVNSIDGPLVLYDAFLGTERPIIDGICLSIETPEVSHERRYYIRRPGYTPEEDSDPVTTGNESYDTNQDQATKIIHNGHVFIIRNGHVYTTLGQKIR